MYDVMTIFLQMAFCVGMAKTATDYLKIFNPNAHLITGTIGAYRIEARQNSLTTQV